MQASEATPFNDLGAERAVLRAALAEAGDIAHRFFRKDVRHWTKGGSSPVSEADLAVDQHLRARLSGAFPDYGWLSEESVDDRSRLDRERVWIVDPIDGTRAFLDGREDWCVSVALVAAGRPVLGGLIVPASGDLYLAEAGGGATMNGRNLTATDGGEIQGILLGGPAALCQRLGLPGRGMRFAPRIGSLALRLAYVADGRLDVAIAGAHSQDWDLAAADLLVHEAGGLMTSLAGQTLAYNKGDVGHDVLVAAGGARHALLLSEIGEPPRQAEPVR